MKPLILRAILFGLVPLLRKAAKKPAFAREMARHSCVVQVKLMDNSIGRYSDNLSRSAAEFAASAKPMLRASGPRSAI